MTVTYISFRITYEPPIMSKISEVISNMDLGIIKVSSPVSERITYSTTTKVDKRYTTTMNEIIRRKSKDGGREVINIEVNTLRVPDCMRTIVEIILCC